MGTREFLSPGYGLLLYKIHVYWSTRTFILAENSFFKRHTYRPKVSYQSRLVSCVTRIVSREGGNLILSAILTTICAKDNLQLISSEFPWIKAVVIHVH